jgi:hypothetical protein
MKHLTLVVFFMCIAVSSFAQQPQGAPTRLFSSRTDNYDGTSFHPHDSAHYTYSGDRGGIGQYGQNEYLILFDLAHHLSASGTTWNDSLQTTKTYDANDRLLTLLSQIYDGSNWINSKREVHSWVTNNKREDTVSSYYWNGSKWEPTSKFIYNFDALGRVIEEFQEKGDTISGGWATAYWYLTHYNHFGDIDTQISQTMSWQSGAWQNLSMFVSIVDTVHELSSFLYSWSAGVWNKGSRDTFIYYADNGNSITVDSEFTWSSNQSTWTPYYLNTYVYDKDNRLVNSTKQSYNVNQQAWVKQLQQNTTYSPDNSAQQSILYLGDAGTNTWYPYSNTVWNINQSGLIVSEMDSSWQTLWVPATSHYYWYTENSGSGVKASPQVISSSVYPNPFTKTFTITFISKKEGDVMLKLYDMTGRLITKTMTNISVGENKIVWDAGFALPKGCYTYDLVVGNVISNGKIISE